MATTLALSESLDRRAKQLARDRRTASRPEFAHEKRVTKTSVARAALAIGLTLLEAQVEAAPD